MTTERLEIVVEGSDDGQQWRAYEFPYKPGDVNRAPRWAAPYQPRLDWQMWFAALGDYRTNPWFVAFRRAVARRLARSAGAAREESVSGSSAALRARDDVRLSVFDLGGASARRVRGGIASRMASICRRWDCEPPPIVRRFSKRRHCAGYKPTRRMQSCSTKHVRRLTHRPRVPENRVAHLFMRIWRNWQTR